MEVQLGQAEGKVVLLATTAEGIYRSTDWLNDRLHRTIQELSFLVEQIEKKSLADVRLTQARLYVKEYKEEGYKRLAPFNEATTNLLDAFPALGGRMFSQTVDSGFQSVAMQTWVKETKKPGEKLSDPKDARVNQHGKIVYSAIDETNNAC